MMHNSRSWPALPASPLPAESRSELADAGGGDARQDRVEGGAVGPAQSSLHLGDLSCLTYRPLHPLAHEHGWIHRQNLHRETLLLLGGGGDGRPAAARICGRGRRGGWPVRVQYATGAHTLWRAPRAPWLSIGLPDLIWMAMHGLRAARKPCRLSLGKGTCTLGAAQRRIRRMSTKPRTPPVRPFWGPALLSCDVPLLPAHSPARLAPPAPLSQPAWTCRWAAWASDICI